MPRLFFFFLFIFPYLLSAGGGPAEALICDPHCLLQRGDFNVVRASALLPPDETGSCIPLIDH